MDDNLLLHPVTKRHLDAFAFGPSNALLISGQPGAGKKTLARFLSATLLNSNTQKLDNHPYFFVIRRPESKNEIPIDDIRTLIKNTNLRVAAPGAINRVALIEDAEHLSTEAQNALLKLLEEPPAATLLILTAASEDKLLPTIISRVQRLKVLPASLEASKLFFNTYPETEIDSAWRLARGAAGLQAALLSGKADHPLKQAVEDAKRFLKSDRYQRLLVLQGLAKDKQRMVVFLEALSRVLSALQTDSAGKQKTAQGQKILEARQAIERQHNYADANVNSRLASLALGLDITL